MKKPDGSIKLLVYRKKAHTNQYLNFQSHHPLQHKLGVIRTLLDRMNKVVTEEGDKEAEKQTIQTALQKCGYPQWAFDKVESAIKQKQQQVKPAKKKDDANRNKGLVVIPYVQGLSEKAQRIFKKHNIATAMKPMTTLRNILVHPKDKREKDKITDCVYEIPCQGCEATYVGETGRAFGTRKQEHVKSVEKTSKNRFTRANRKASDSEFLTSALAEHVSQNNHVIGWEDSSILTTENDKYTRWVKESIWIRWRGTQSMNRVDGIFKLSHFYDVLISGDESVTSINTNRTLVSTSNNSSRPVHHLADEKSRL